MFETMDDFIDYVWSFYGEHENTLYPMKGLTKKMIAEASWIHLQMCCYPSFPNITWGDGDSIDRERVRDILIDKFNLKWSH
tara:strand:- start:257 stop:499 length:243 start_codon:yes stop_codon:yes gene_type:complete